MAIPGRSKDPRGGSPQTFLLLTSSLRYTTHLHPFYKQDPLGSLESRRGCRQTQGRTYRKLPGAEKPTGGYGRAWSPGPRDLVEEGGDRDPQLWRGDHPEVPTAPRASPPRPSLCGIVLSKSLRLTRSPLWGNFDASALLCPRHRAQDPLGLQIYLLKARRIQKDKAGAGAGEA